MHKLHMKSKLFLVLPSTSKVHQLLLELFLQSHSSRGDSGQGQRGAPRRKGVDMGASAQALCRCCLRSRGETSLVT